MENRCPDCNALLKDKHLTDGKCWKCGANLNLKTEKKEFKESQKIKTDKNKAMSFFEGIFNKKKLSKLTLYLEYEIMYNDKDFIIEEELQIGCLNPDGSGKYTDFSDFFQVNPISDVKNRDLSNDNKKYSLYENRTATFEIEYDESSIDHILEKINIFQFNQSEGILMSELDSNKIGRIDLVKVKDSRGNEKKIKNDEKLNPNYDYAEKVDFHIKDIPYRGNTNAATAKLVFDVSNDNAMLFNTLKKLEYYIKDKSIYGNNEKGERIIEITTNLIREIGYLYFIGEDGNVWRSKSDKYIEKDNHFIIYTKITSLVTNLLREKAVKMPASDIDAHLKTQNVDQIKKICEEMYHNGEISRTANYRYFILTEEKKQSKKTSKLKPEAVDVKAELKKFKEMLDEGLIEQEDYDAKKKELLGF